ncbi:MAG: hypothetical protein J7K89_00850 [Candidatus Cloacimonetes bacterium]|nr:hypothetical protein [Candidatus Cloacimonadota bacterium]
MKQFREEMQRRWEERRSKKYATWANLILRILLLAFVVMVIAFFADPDIDKFRNFFEFLNQAPIPREVG